MLQKSVFVMAPGCSVLSQNLPVGAITIINGPFPPPGVKISSMELAASVLTGNGLLDPVPVLVDKDFRGKSVRLILLAVVIIKRPFPSPGVKIPTMELSASVLTGNSLLDPVCVCVCVWGSYRSRFWLLRASRDRLRPVGNFLGSLMIS